MCLGLSLSLFFLLNIMSLKCEVFKNSECQILENHFDS
ncbi:rCG55197 [Rattus norvegicus]|uniref:RCG55197 n=1 Tax=Rattus norvegicus TaxID=10116 RepID=A6J867_RAT|nr:rCG55197 [Rattus norvegicus]